MRRGILAGLVVGAIVSIPLDAAADGGAYIEFDRTHYLPGTLATGSGYVSVPRKHQDRLELGPFFVYVVPPRGWIEPNRPLPDGVIRVGTATIEHDEAKTFEVRVAFTVPDVVLGDYYSVQVCNDPCTITGFRETLSGTISIVQTEREARLLNEQQELYGRYWGVRQKLRKATRTLDEVGVPPGEGDERITELTSEIERLERRLAAFGRSSAAGPPETVGDDQPLVDGWALVAIALALIVALLAVALAIVFSRRTPTVVVPDTIEELDEVEPQVAVR
ncbi:MAG: hypothetical protein L0206_23280 [Actinobacteria bacterium]|nr:hypothetical protein [Actinomycetota bacterium]